MLPCLLVLLSCRFVMSSCPLGLSSSDLSCRLVYLLYRLVALRNSTCRSHNLDLSDTFCSSIVSKIIKMFHQFPPTNNRRHLIDRQICICKRFYRLRFRHVICHVILSTHHVVLLLVVLSCVSCHVMFRAYPIKKSWTGLWTLDSGPPPAPSPQQENVVKKN